MCVGVYEDGKLKEELLNFIEEVWSDVNVFVDFIDEMVCWFDLLVFEWVLFLGRFEFLILCEWYII